MICSLLQNGAAWGLLQPPLSQITNPVFGTSGGTVPATADLPKNLSPYIKDVTAAIRLGKALFWDMQAGSDGVTACASCHYRAGADPVVGTAPNATAKRDKNQLHPGPDTIFGNNSTVVKTQAVAVTVDAHGLAGLRVPSSDGAAAGRTNARKAPRQRVRIRRFPGEAPPPDKRRRPRAERARAIQPGPL